VIDCYLLINQVPEVAGTDEAVLPRRLSLLSGHNIDHLGMAAINEEERQRRRSSLPLYDPTFADLKEEDSEEDLWEGSCHVISV